MEFSLIEIVGYVGSAFTLTAVSMKTMIPLRFFAMCSNAVFIVYAYQLNLPSILMVQCILLPLNGYRLYEMRKLVRDVKQAASGDLSVDWLLPYMSKIPTQEDQVLFRKGDAADRLYYIKEGRVLLPEIDSTLDAGAVIGEIGLFSPDGRRTTSAVCSGACVVMGITADRVYELYHQNPEFGFYMIRNVAQRLMRDVERLEKAEMARKA